MSRAPSPIPVTPRTLADLVRTDRHHHRQIAGDTPDAQALKVLARAHQRVIWDRQRQINRLRSILREFFPAALDALGTDLAHPDALGLLARSPTPAAAAALSAIGAALRKGGRQRNVAARAAELQEVLRRARLDAPAAVAAAYGAQVRSAVGVIAEMTRQIAALELEAELTASFELHPDAEIVRSLPGLGTILGARVLGEFGDDPERYADAGSRKNYAGTSPVTRASGNKKAVLARYVRNRHLADACHQWAFCATNTSAGARAFYDEHRATGESHDQALQVLSNRPVGILDGCLRSTSLYDEQKAWQHRAGHATTTTVAA